MTSHGLYSTIWGRRRPGCVSAKAGLHQFAANVLAQLIPAAGVALFSARIVVRLGIGRGFRLRGMRREVRADLGLFSSEPKGLSPIVARPRVSGWRAASEGESCHGAARLAGALELAEQHAQNRIAAKVIVVVEVLIAQRQAENALRDRALSAWTVMSRLRRSAKQGGSLYRAPTCRSNPTPSIEASVSPAKIAGVF
jgi:hypothetical protein